MGYLQEADRWLDAIFTDLTDGKMTYAEVKREAIDGDIGQNWSSLHVRKLLCGMKSTKPTFLEVATAALAGSQKLR